MDDSRRSDNLGDDHLRDEWNAFIEWFVSYWTRRGHDLWSDQEQEPEAADGALPA